MPYGILKNHLKAGFVIELQWRRMRLAPFTPLRCTRPYTRIPCLPFACFALIINKILHGDCFFWQMNYFYLGNNFIL
mgnify:CR=1 FL=1|jgi:hypothetical protein